MTRILWKLIKDELLLPFVDLKTEYYDLGLDYRNKTNDQVTFDSAEATKKYGVAVKCATITPNAARMPEYNLKEMWKSPNGTIRAILDGTVFRAPIIVKGIEPYVKNWTKPITIARHAYGDVYKGVEMKIPAAGKTELVYTNEAGEETRELIHEFDGPGIIQGMHNINKSIESFARSCFNFALDTKQDLWFATKDTISKKYDHTFKDIFADIFENEYKEKFDEAGIEYFYTLIDDAVARVMRSEGGYIWACKNYDGDVMSDMVATAFGSLSMMTSVLASVPIPFSVKTSILLFLIVESSGHTSCSCFWLIFPLNFTSLFVEQCLHQNQIGGFFMNTSLRINAACPFPDNSYSLTNICIKSLWETLVS